MPDREGRKFVAGGGKKLGVIRYGREEMTQHELGAGDTIFPGQAVMPDVEDGEDVFVHHSGDESDPVYIAVEARGRGMDAQTDEGYVEGEDEVIAVSASGGGLHLSVANGENVTKNDALVPGVGTGNFVVETDEGWNYAHADENEDLSGATEPGLVKGEVN